MKKVLVCLLVLFLAGPRAVSAQPENVVRKTTFLYAVKGTDSLFLDKYDMPAADTLRPCMVFVFGGGFSGGVRDNAYYLPYFRYLAESGFCVVSLDYRLGLKNIGAQGNLNALKFIPVFVNAVTMAVEDLFDATAYVLGHAAEWSVDPAMILANGSSAGAITVLQGEYALCNGWPMAAKLPEGFNYAGVISFAGAILNLGGELAWKRTPCPIQLFHGDADANVPYGKVADENGGFFGSESIAAGLTAARIPHYFYSIENAAHEIAGNPMYDNRDDILSFVDKLVVRKLPLMIDTDVTEIGKPAVKKDFTIMDYVRANYAPQPSAGEGK